MPASETAMLFTDPVANHIVRVAEQELEVGPLRLVDLVSALGSRLDTAQFIPSADPLATGSDGVKAWLHAQRIRWGLSRRSRRWGICQILEALLTESGRCCGFEYQGNRFVCLVYPIVFQRTFTHRVTEADLRQGGLDITGDLDLLAASITRRWVATTTMSLAYGDQAGWRGLFGTSQWLAKLSPGDLVAMKITDAGVEVNAHPEPLLADGSYELEALLDVLEPRFADEQGVNLADATIAAIASRRLESKREIFIEPTLPITDLLAQRKVSRRFYHFGPPETDWYVPGSKTRHLRWAQRTPPRLGSCCRSAIRQALKAFDGYVYASQSRPTSSVHTASEAVVHHNVARILVDTVAEDCSAADLRLFADRCLVGMARDLFLAVIDEYDHRLAPAITAYEMLTTQRTAPAGALEALAWVRFDQSDFAGAVELLGQVHGPAHDDVRYMASLAALVHALNGYQQCECLSQDATSRWCQHCEPELDPTSRFGLVRSKLVNYGRRTADGAILCGRLVDASRASEIAKSNAGFIFDLAAIDAGFGFRFLAARGALLPVSERRLLVDWLAARLRCIRLEGDTNTRDGHRIAQDVISGETFRLAPSLGQADQAQTSHLIGRVIPAAGPAKATLLAGASMEVDPHLWDEAISVIRQDPPPLDLLTWLAGTQGSTGDAPANICGSMPM